MHRVDRPASVPQPRAQREEGRPCRTRLLFRQKAALAGEEEVVQEDPLLAGRSEGEEDHLLPVQAHQRVTSTADGAARRARRRPVDQGSSQATAPHPMPTSAVWLTRTPAASLSGLVVPTATAMALALVKAAMWRSACAKS